jgi:hypothetical protein
MSAAKDISARFQQIGDTMSGRCYPTDAQDSVGMSMPREQKEILDTLRRRHRLAYRTMARAAIKFAGLPANQQLQALQADIPRIMMLVRSR